MQSLFSILSVHSCSYYLSYYRSRISVEIYMRWFHLCSCDALYACREFQEALELGSESLRGTPPQGTHVPLVVVVVLEF